MSRINNSLSMRRFLVIERVVSEKKNFYPVQFSQYVSFSTPMIIQQNQSFWARTKQISPKTALLIASTLIGSIFVRWFYHESKRYGDLQLRLIKEIQNKIDSGLTSQKEAMELESRLQGILDPFLEQAKKEKSISKTVGIKTVVTQTFFRCYSAINQTIELTKQHQEAVASFTKIVSEAYEKNLLDSSSKGAEDSYENKTSSLRLLVNEKHEQFEQNKKMLEGIERSLCNKIDSELVRLKIKQ